LYIVFVLWTGDQLPPGFVLRDVDRLSIFSGAWMIVSGASFELLRFEMIADPLALHL
jgi:hypothetical protein